MDAKIAVRGDQAVEHKTTNVPTLVYNLKRVGRYQIRVEVGDQSDVLPIKAKG